MTYKWVRVKFFGERRSVSATCLIFGKRRAEEYKTRRADAATLAYDAGMDRYWLLTNTTYGSWLPGDERGFVGRVWEHRLDDNPAIVRIEHDRPGTEYDEAMRGLQQTAREKLCGPPIALNVEHAKTLLKQFQETAQYRGWELRAVAIMFNHFHIVIGVPGDPKPAKILGDFKSWGTRALSKEFGEPLSETWYSGSGSKRKLPDEQAVLNAIHYVLYEQFNALITWSPENGLHFGPPPR